MSCTVFELTEEVDVVLLPLPTAMIGDPAHAGVVIKSIAIAMQIPVFFFICNSIPSCPILIFYARIAFPAISVFFCFQLYWLFVSLIQVDASINLARDFNQLC